MIAVSDKKLYDAIRGVPGKLEVPKSKIEQLKCALFDECKAKQAWKRRAEWLAGQLAEVECLRADERGTGERDEACTPAYWLKRAENEAEK